MDNIRLQRDKRILSGIFPEVVWLLVYGHLMYKIGTIETLEYMFHASVYFRQLLYSQRNLLLLPGILFKVFDYDIHYKPLSNSRYSANPSLLKMRLVCRSWCGTVDKIMLSMLHKSTTKILPREEVGFLSRFEGSHSHATHNKSPFICHAFTYSLEGDPINLMMPFEKLLPKYGSWIHYCNIDFDCGSVSKQWLEAVVMHFVFWMPNLRKLEIELFLMEDNGEPYNFPYAANLPELPNLICLKLRLKTKSDVIPEKLLPRMPNLKKFRMTQYQQISSSDDLLPGLVSTQLKDMELVLKFHGGYREPCQEYILEHPPTKQHPCLMDAALHVTLLTLEAHSPMRCLRRLTITLNCVLPFSWHEWRNYKIDIPNLTFLCLTSWTWPCIDMALLFRNSLDRLFIDVKTVLTFEQWSKLEWATELMEMEQIKFLSSIASLDKDSNSWKLLPNLTEVFLSINVTGDTEEICSKLFYPNRKNEVYGFKDDKK